MASDLATVDAIISALYQSTRHTSEKPQDWERFRSLFVPNAVLVQAASNSYFNYEYGIEDYIEEAKYLRDKNPTAEWFEAEVSRQTHQIGDVAHVFSFYVFGSPTQRTRPKFYTNSFHLVKDDRGNWRVTSWHWSAETPTTKINLLLLMPTTPASTSGVDKGKKAKRDRYYADSRPPLRPV